MGLRRRVSKSFRPRATSAFLGLLVFGSVAPAHAEEKRIVWVGEASPWVELLRAELALINVAVEPAFAPVPESSEQARERIDEWEATGLVVSGDPARIYLATCGELRETAVPTESPGRSTLMIAELIWAHLGADCEPDTEPDTPARSTPTPSAPTPATLSTSASSRPTARTPTKRSARTRAPAPTTRTRRTPTARTELRTPARTAELRTPNRSAREPTEVQRIDETARAHERSRPTELQAPPPTLDTDVVPVLRTTIEVLGLAGYDSDHLAGRYGASFGLSHAVHSHLALTLHATIGAGGATPDPIRSATSGTIDAGLRVLFPLGPWTLTAEGGASLLWVRARFEPNLGVGVQRDSYIGYHFGAALSIPVTERLSVRVSSKLTQSGRRRAITLAGRDYGRWGPIIQTGLGLSLHL